MYGPDRGCIALVWPLAPHPTNKNELIVWDCSASPEELLTLNAAAIRERMFTKQDALPEGATRLPIKTIHVNKSPIVIGNLKTLSPAMAERWGHDTEAQLANARLLAGKSQLLDGLWGDVFQREPFAPADVDEDLYGGFIGNEDRRTLNRVRVTAPEQLAERAAQGKLAFQDGRLDELVFRWRARNFPATLSADEAERWQGHLAARLHEGEGGAQTLAAFMERIDQLGEAADERGEEILSALYEYAEQIAP
jgi:exodeoxyribonuclease-1